MYSSAKSRMRTQLRPNCQAMKGAAMAMMMISQRAAVGLRLPSQGTAATSSFMFRARSGPVRHAFAEQSGGAEDQHQAEDDEGEDVLVGRVEEAEGEVLDVARAEGFDQAEHDAAEHGAAQVADAAQHRGGEGLEPRHEAHAVVGDAV